MSKILIGECKQETSSFNPQPARYEDFVVEFGPAILDHRRSALARQRPRTAFWEISAVKS